MSNGFTVEPSGKQLDRQLESTCWKTLTWMSAHWGGMSRVLMMGDGKNTPTGSAVTCGGWVTVLVIAVPFMFMFISISISMSIFAVFFNLESWKSC